MENWIEDLKSSAVMFCSTFGIGSLSMAYCFAQAGFLNGIFILCFVTLCSWYSSQILSHALIEAPQHVITYGDLAFHIAGKTGRGIVNCTLGASCLLVPIAYLVISANDLLPYLFQDIAPKVSSVEWIIIWSIVILPVVFIPTLKDTTTTNFIGTVAPLIACTIAVIITLIEVDFQKKKSSATINNILSSFGAISFSFGTACLIPSIHREHPSPERIPAILTCTLIAIFIFYAILGGLGYYQFGCTAPSDILTVMPDGMWKSIAYAAMLLHITLAYVVVLNPAIYMLERAIFKQPNTISEQIVETNLPKHALPVIIEGRRRRDSIVHIQLNYTRFERFISILIRTLIVLLEALCAILADTSFIQVLDLIGATTVTFSCIITPCCLYLIMSYKHISLMTKILNIMIITINITWGIYASYSAVKILSKQSNFINSTNIYPFCEQDEKVEV